MEILIALAIAYLIVSPDRVSLTATRGLAGAVRGGATGRAQSRRRSSSTRSSGKSSTGSSSSRPRAILDGWREGVATARARRDEGRDAWSRGSRLAGRTAGGAASLATGARGAVRAVRQRRTDKRTERREAAEAKGDLIVDAIDKATRDAGPEAPSVPETPSPSPVSGTGGQNGDQAAKPVQSAQPTKPTKPTNPAEPASESGPVCAICDGSRVWDGRPCPSCDYDAAPGRRYDGPNPVRRTPDNPSGDADNQTPADRPVEPAMPTPGTSTINTPKGAGQMTLARTELANVDEVDAEIKAVEATVEEWEAVGARIKTWTDNIGDRWAGAKWNTKGLTTKFADAPGLAARMQGHSTELLDLLAAIRAELKRARAVGEAADAAQASGDLSGFKAA